MHRSLVSVAALAAALWSAPAQAIHVPQDEARLEVDPSLSNRGIVAESEFYCMTLAIFFEGGSTGETEDGLRHIARVIGERAKANRRIWGGPTICGVVFHQVNGVCQFSSSCAAPAEGRRRTRKRGPL